MRFKTLGQATALLGAAFILSGCEPLASTEDSRTYAELGDAYDTLHTRYATAEGTPAADVPSTGTATYKGIATMDVGGVRPSGAPGPAADAGYNLLSNITLNADFDTQSISGKMTGFRDQDNLAWGGQVVIGSSQMSDSGSGTKGFTSDATGQLDRDGVAYSAALLVGGNFVGADAQAITGGVMGSLTPDGGVGETVQGAFITERQ